MSSQEPGEILQNERIQAYINENVTCKVSKKSPEAVSKKVLEKILSKTYISGADMKVLECLVETMFVSSGKDEGNLSLDPSIKKWITKLKRLSVDSTAGDVFFADIVGSELEVVLKKAQRLADEPDMAREYYIGSAYLNKLRYIIPNYAYILGAFKCGGETHATLCKKGMAPKLLVIYEKIQGRSIDKSNMSLEQTVGFLAQLLLALEIGQVECNFTHFDLHVDNVIAKPVKKYSHTVVYGASQFEIKSNDFIPVIIDYGMSAVTDTGDYTFEQVGMMNFIIPAFDHIKYLESMRQHGVHKELCENVLGEFYKGRYPYDNHDDYWNPKHEGCYGRFITYSRIASSTPMELLRWLSKHEVYGPMVKKYVVEIERDVYIPKPVLSKDDAPGVKYANLFGNPAVSGTVSACIAPTNSYVLNTYNSELFALYGLPEASSVLDQVNLTLKDLLVRNDVETSHSLAVNVPNCESAFEDASYSTLNMPDDEIRMFKKVFDEFLQKVDYPAHSATMAFIYTVIETTKGKALPQGGVQPYKDIVSKYKGSEAYNFSVKFSKYEKVRRWAYALKSYLERFTGNE